MYSAHEHAEVVSLKIFRVADPEKEDDRIILIDDTFVFTDPTGYMAELLIQSVIDTQAVPMLWSFSFLTAVLMRSQTDEAVRAVGSKWRENRVEQGNSLRVDHALDEELSHVAGWVGEHERIINQNDSVIFFLRVGYTEYFQADNFSMFVSLCTTHQRNFRNVLITNSEWYIRHY